MSSTKQKLRLAGAFAALATLALAGSCRGFFVNPTLTAITISPASPQVEINTTLVPPLSVFGTFSDGSTGPVSSGVSWSSETPSVATITPGGSLAGVSLGTATIQASAQAVSASATATVFLGGITAIVIQPSSGSVSITQASIAQFTATATANGAPVDITTQGAIWTVTPASQDVTCTPDGTEEDCSAVTGAPTGNYTLTVSYPGTTIVATATLTVDP
jgi:hypothetical protein